ncbi:MAG: AAA family ATPase [Collimonas pratensis]|uniref:AAA family ATPase n=1 Tax=Collimonas pratensis TaxID=279113 RepID=UPI003C715717
MALLDEILAWSTSSLKPWQQDAARRLFQQTLNVAALDDLYAMLKDSVGIPDPNQRKAEPLDQHHLPITAAKDSAVVLVSLRDVKNVNRLAASQTLAFAPKGLTVIYGGNGSGKSGYARILKRACRSRDTNEDVRPNAHSKGAAGATPQASFEIQLSGKESTVIWKKGNASPVELATVAVFDTHCARAYLDQQQEIAYLPFGLDVVENLAQVVLPKITEKLNAEIAATATTKDAFNHLVSTTKVGALISSLSEKTKLADVDALTQMTEAETKKIAELEKTLNESDPKTKAKEFKLAAARMTGLKTKIETAAAWVKEESIQKLRKMDTETQEALTAEVNAANALRSGEALLPGTGDVLWKAMFQAAKEFSVGAAYPENIFPHVHDGSQCVLCQQKIEPDAATRLQRFEAYVQENVAKVANDKRVACAAALVKIGSAVLALDLEDHLIEELRHLDTEVVAEINAFDAVVQSKRTWLLNAQKNHSWDGAPPFPTDPCVRLKTIAEHLTAQEKAYEQATDDKQKQLLKTELAELKARALLVPQRQALLDLIERMRIKSLLTKCKDHLKTKPISDKAKEFASNAVTAPLRLALKEEFEALGVATLMPRLDESVERGKMRHKLELNLEVQAQIREILSEGEQRAVALGSFLAELRTGGHGGGIVFDDPVSSLDHFRRQNVAQRLVDEAKVRQVIIFTHDTSFLGDLLDLIEKTGIDHIIHYLEWEGEYAGKISDGLPWLHQTFKGRIDELQQAQAKLAKTWSPYPSDAQTALMRTQYSRVRATIERAIQDIVFNGVVVRYRDWIKVTQLSNVVGFDAVECAEIERLYKICCDVVDAHDSSSGKNAAVPTAVQLGSDIAALLAVTEAIKKRQKGKATPGAAGVV